MRLDLYLTDRALADSREKAKKLILGGFVAVNGAVCKKPALDVGDTDMVEIMADPFRFVGRGGEKLEHALAVFGIDPFGAHALDIGASTGGFTDCLLQHGAASVVALDTGLGQLHPKLLADPRVKNLEKYNARGLRREDVGDVTIAVMDVSFISATYIIPRVAELLPEGGVFLCLVKPQFEAGRGALNKQGVVKHAEDRVFAVRRVLSAAAEVGLATVGLAPSPITGGDGNVEFLAYFRRRAASFDINTVPIEEIVRKGVVFR